MGGYGSISSGRYGDLTERNYLHRVVSPTEEVEFVCLFYCLFYIPILIASTMI